MKTFCIILRLLFKAACMAFRRKVSKTMSIIQKKNMGNVCYFNLYRTGSESWIFGNLQPYKSFEEARQAHCEVIQKYGFIWHYWKTVEAKI